MTEKQAEKLSKYFGQGVRAHIWCSGGRPSCMLSIQREQFISFGDLASLKWAVLMLYRGVEAGRKNLELWPKDAGSVWDAMNFRTPEEAAECMVEVEKALRHIQSISTDDSWHEIPQDLFELWQSLAPTSDPTAPCLMTGQPK